MLFDFDGTQRTEAFRIGRRVIRGEVRVNGLRRYPSQEGHRLRVTATGFALIRTT